MTEGQTGKSARPTKKPTQPHTGSAQPDATRERRWLQCGHL